LNLLGKNKKQRKGHWADSRAVAHDHRIGGPLA
jgi:hypothetical protein